MPDGMAEKLGPMMAELNPSMRVEFAMHGEPTVHPKGPDIIKTLRRSLPDTQFMLTTNGATFRKKPKSISKWFRAGIDIIVVDTYEPERKEVIDACQSMAHRHDVVDFYKDWVPAKLSPYGNHKRKIRNTVVLMDDISLRDREVASRVLLNHAGGNPQLPLPKEPLAKTCTNPFREVTVTWNGEVRICCMDWRGDYVAGNMNDRSLHDIWYGKELEAARRLLQAKDRRFSPCAYCDKGSGTRSGLLPKLPPPTPEDYATVEEVTGKGAGDQWAHPKSTRSLKVIK